MEYKEKIDANVALIPKSWLSCNISLRLIQMEAIKRVLFFKEVFLSLKEIKQFVFKESLHCKHSKEFRTKELKTKIKCMKEIKIFKISYASKKGKQKICYAF